MYQVIPSSAFTRCPVVHSVKGTAGIAIRDRTIADTSCSWSREMTAAAIDHTIAPNSTARTAQCQKDHSLTAADHSTESVSKETLVAIANAAAVAPSAIPRPKFSNVVHTKSPMLQP